MSEHLIHRRRLCIALAALAGPAVAAGDEQARQIVEQADRIRNPQQPFQVTLRLVEYRNGQARQSATLRLHAKLQPATQRFRNLARFLEPAADVGKIRVRLDDRMLDLDKPVTIVAGEKQAFQGNVPRTIATMARTLAERGDPAGIFSGEVEVEIPASK